MFELLKTVFNLNKNISIYTDCNNTSKFVYGRILCFDDEMIAIYMISPDGEFDGVLVKSIDKIFRLEVEGQYENKMKKLCSLRELPSFDYLIEQNKITESMLHIALKSNQIVSLELVDSGFDDVVGFVEEVSNGGCKIRQVDNYGFDDGYSFIMVEDITQISYASQDENRILKLWEYNNP